MTSKGIFAGLVVLLAVFLVLFEPPAPTTNNNDYDGATFNSYGAEIYAGAVDPTADTASDVLGTDVWYLNTSNGSWWTRTNGTWTEQYEYSPPAFAGNPVTSMVYSGNTLTLTLADGTLRTATIREGNPVTAVAYTADMLTITLADGSTQSATLPESGANILSGNGQPTAQTGVDVTGDVWYLDARTGSWYERVSGVWESRFRFPASTRILSGRGAPLLSGVSGSWYLDVASGAWYEYAAGAWQARFTPQAGNPVTAVDFESLSNQLTVTLADGTELTADGIDSVAPAPSNVRYGWSTTRNFTYDTVSSGTVLIEGVGLLPFIPDTTANANVYVYFAIPSTDRLLGFPRYDYVPQFDFFSRFELQLLCPDGSSTGCLNTYVLREPESRLIYAPDIADLTAELYAYPSLYTQQYLWAQYGG